MAKFNDLKEKYLETLKLYVPIVDRVHGQSHPEFHEVRRVFEAIINKIETAGEDSPELDSEFAELRKVTDNYSVPGDVCESYEAVYKMLAELDAAH